MFILSGIFVGILLSYVKVSVPLNVTPWVYLMDSHLWTSQAKLFTIAGILLNCIVMLSNARKMPVFSANSWDQLSASLSSSHVIAESKTRLLLLADIIETR